MKTGGKGIGGVIDTRGCRAVHGEDSNSNESGGDWSPTVNDSEIGASQGFMGHCGFQGCWWDGWGSRARSRGRRRGGACGAKGRES